VSFIAPILAVIIFKSTLYDGWRQMFFIYTSFLMIALAGIRLSSRLVSQFFGKKWAPAIMGVVLLASFGSTIHFMIRYHPHQTVYFNQLAGRNMLTIKHRFELDYWGLSYYQALKYIADNDPSDGIKISVDNEPGIYNTYLLDNSDRSRLIVASDMQGAKYFIGNFRVHPYMYPYTNEFYSIKIGNAKILVVYKLE
jgi:hypothetical protein